MGRPSSAPAAAVGKRKFRRAENPPPGTVSRRNSVASSAGSEKSLRQRSLAVAGSGAGSAAGPTRSPAPAPTPACVSGTVPGAIQVVRRRPASASTASVAVRPSAARQAHRARRAVEADLSSNLCVGSRRIIQERQIESRVHRPLTGKLQVGTNALTESFLRCRMGRQCVGGKSPAVRGGAASPWAWEEWEDEAADAAAAAEKVAAAKAAKQAELDREQGLQPQIDESAEKVFAELDRDMSSAARPLTPERGLPSRMCRFLDGVILRHEQSLSRISINDRSSTNLSAGVESTLCTSSVTFPHRNETLRARLDELHSRRPPPMGAEAAEAQAVADMRVLRRLKRFNRAPSMKQLRAVSHPHL